MNEQFIIKKDLPLSVSVADPNTGESGLYTGESGLYTVESGLITWESVILS